jgi:hypothetical protein
MEMLCTTSMTDPISSNGRGARALAGSCSDRGVALTHTKMAEEYERRAAGHIDTINVTAVRAS